MHIRYIPVGNTILDLIEDSITETVQHQAEAEGIIYDTALHFICTPGCNWQVFNTAQQQGTNNSETVAKVTAIFSKIAGVMSGELVYATQAWEVRVVKLPHMEVLRSEILANLYEAEDILQLFERSLYKNVPSTITEIKKVFIQSKGKPATIEPITKSIAMIRTK